MAYTIKIIFADNTEYQVEQYTDRDFTLNQACFSNTFQHVRNSLNISIVSVPEIRNKFLNNTSWVSLEMKEGTTNIFTGVISPTISTTLSNGLDYIDIEAIDYSDYLDISLTQPIILTNTKLWDSTNPTNSVVHVLADLVPSKELTIMSGTADFTIPYLAFRKGDKVSQILNDVFYSYGYQYYFDASGTLNIIQWNTDTTTTTATIQDDGNGFIDGSFNIKQKENSNSTPGSEGADTVESYYTPIETVSNALVGFKDFMYKKSNGQYFYSQAVTPALKANWNSFYGWPVYFDTDETFGQSATSYRMNYSRLPNDDIIDINIKTVVIEFYHSWVSGSYNSELYMWNPHTVTMNVGTMADSSISVYNKTAGTTKIFNFETVSKTKKDFSEWEFYFKKKNTSENTSPIILKRIAFYGDVIIQRPEQAITNAVTGAKNNIIKIDNKYLYEKKYAEAFADMYQKNILTSSVEYSFKSYNKYDLGINLEIIDSAKSFTSKAKILKRSYNQLTRIYTYELKGLVGITVPATTTPPVIYPTGEYMGVTEDGHVTGIIESALLPENVTPSHSGLTLTRERFGWYDATNDVWKAYTDNDGNQHLNGVLDVGNGIESSNFLTGVSGFQIQGNGDAEFNNIAIRSSILKYSGTPITSDDVVNLQYLNANTYPWSSNNTWIRRDETGSFGGNIIKGVSFQASTDPALGSDLVRKSYFDNNILKPLNGLIIANNGDDLVNDIDITAGSVPDTTLTKNITLPTNMTKKLDATFTAGNNQGMLDTGSKANSTWYAIYVISKDDGTTDVLASVSPTAPTMPTGYTNKRRIAWIYTNASGSILGFNQYGREFFYNSYVANYNSNTTANTWVTQTVTAPPNSKVILSLTCGGGGMFFAVAVHTGYTGSASPTGGFGYIASAPAAQGAGQVRIPVDSNRQIKIAISGYSWLAVTSMGFIDDLGLPGSLTQQTYFPAFQANGTIDGFSIANNNSTPNTHLDISAGVIRDRGYSSSILMTTGTTKRIDSNFSAGNGGGMLDTGTKSNSTWYAIMAIGKTDGTSDILATLTPSSPTMPSGFTLYRRIGWIYIDGSGNITQFSKVGNCYELKTQATIRAYTSNSSSSRQTTTTGLLPPNCTVNLALRYASGTQNSTAWFRSTSFTDVVSAFGNCDISCPVANQSFSVRIPVNSDASGQIAWRQANADWSLEIMLVSFIDEV